MTQETNWEGPDPDQFLLSDYDRQKYHKSMTLSKVAGIPGVIFIYGMIAGIMGFLWNVASHPATFLERQYPIVESINVFDGAAPMSEIYNFGALLFGATALFVLSVRVSNRFESNATESGVSSKDYALDAIARSIEHFEEGDYERSLEKLREFWDLDSNNLPSNLDNQIRKYVRSINLDQHSEYFQTTFPDLANIVLWEIQTGGDEYHKFAEVIASPRKYDQYDVDDDTEQSDEEKSITYLSIILGLLGNLRPSGIVIHFWLIYAVAAGIGITVFLYVNQTLGILTVMILLTALQIYDRQGVSRDSD